VVERQSDNRQGHKQRADKKRYGKNLNHKMLPINYVPNVSEIRRFPKFIHNPAKGVAIAVNGLLVPYMFYLVKA